MAQRSSKKEHDFPVTAFRVVQEATEETKMPLAEPEPTAEERRTAAARLFGHGDPFRFYIAQEEVPPHLGGSCASPPQAPLALSAPGSALAVLTVAAYFLWPAVRPAGPTPPGVVTVTLTMNGFIPNQIESRAGEPITLRLVNNDTKFHTDGGGWHQLAFEALRVDVNVPPETTQEFTFAPATEGSYRFYCSVCCGGKENPSMWGTLEVKA